MVDLTWEYKPGTNLVLADFLSRSYLPCQAEGDLEMEKERHVRIVIE
jgi:hypothetical protein